MFSRILLCFDGSRYSWHVAQVAFEVAASESATLEIMSVVETPQHIVRVGRVDRDYERGRVHIS